MARGKTDSTRTNIYLPNRLIHVAKSLATQRGVTFSEIVRTAIREYLLRELDAISKGGEK